MCHRLAWLTILMLLMGCGAQRSELQPGAAAPAAEPKSAEEAEPESYATIEEAEQALERARSQLDRLAFAEPPPPAPPSAAGAAPSPAPSQPPPAEAERRSVDESKAEKAPLTQSAPAESPASRCSNACRAFASLSRAADAVCRLDAPNGERCGRAKRMVTEAEQRVASCACR